MVLKARDPVLIQKILAHGIPYQIESSRVILSAVLRVKRFLHLSDGSGLQPADDLLGDHLLIVQVNLEFRTLRPERTSRRRNTDMVQLEMNLRLQPLLDLSCQYCHLLYILYLPVDHRTFRMLFLLNGNDLHLLVLDDSDHSDHTACPDIQSKYHILCLRLHLYFFDLSLRHAHPPVPYEQFSYLIRSYLFMLFIIVKFSFNVNIFSGKYISGQLSFQKEKGLMQNSV